MLFFSTRNASHTPPARSGRTTVRLNLEMLEDRCLMSAGALDPSFGSGGLVTAPIQSGQSGGLGPVVVQPADGKIVAGGSITNGKYFNFALVRYNTDGSVDKSFGSGGVVSTAFAKGNSDIRGLALQSNGDIVAVGQLQINKPYQSDFALARYTPAGVLDTSFGSGGIVVTQSPIGRYNDAWANAVTIQPDPSGDLSKEKIYVAGSLYASTIATEFTLIRYNANGSLDATFGQNGIDVTPHFGNGIRDIASALTIQADGKIVVAGGNYSSSSTVPSEMAVARYLPATGTLDSSFGMGGIVMMTPYGTTNSYAGGVLVQSSQNNAIVVSSAYSDVGLALARLSGTGQLDTTFGGSGTGFAINSSMTSAGGIILDPNGDLLTAGTTTNSNLAVVAYLPGGTPDTTFGTGGITTANFTGGSRGGGIAIQPGDGKIVAAGSTGSSIVALARFLPPNTEIGSFTASPNPVTAGSSVTLTASNVLDSNPISTVTQVAFYLDTNGDGILEPGTDTLLGYGIQTSPGVWTYTFSSPSLTSGSYTLFAQAMDSNSVLSDPLTVSLTVM